MNKFWYAWYENMITIMKVVFRLLKFKDSALLGRNVKTVV